MSEVIHDTQHDFWRPPTVRADAPLATIPVTAPGMAAMCAGCGSEFMIAARFCHACGVRRPGVEVAVNADSSIIAGLWAYAVWLRSTMAAIPWRKIYFPGWLHYLHFHEIKRGVGLPTASLVAFLIGLGCVAGAIGVSLFYRASNLAEFQALQLWRMEWLLGATASFVAGILLKKPSSPDNE
ncbi:MAG: hypothetical protein WB562_11735 [Candidatus Sulfotelmatobacter sp.]